MKSLIIAGAIALTPAAAMADAINLAAYSSLTDTELVDFNDLAGGINVGGTVYNGIITSGHASFGEHFAGQITSQSADFDRLDEAPTDPLTLLAGDADRNLSITSRNLDSNAIVPLGNEGPESAQGLGEGALSVLFASGQDRVGFRLFDFLRDDVFVAFYRADGSLIQDITLHNNVDGFFGFTREGGLDDIRGMSIRNTNEQGIFLDDFRFGAAVDEPAAGVPEPAAWALMILGFGLAGVGLRRRRSAFPAAGVGLGQIAPC